MTRAVALCVLLASCASTPLTETEDRIVLHSGYGGHLQATEAVGELSEIWPDGRC